MELMNVDVETRVWPWLQTAEGRTLELASGEVGDVAVAEAPDDPYLRPVDAKGRVKLGKLGGRPARAASGAEDVPQGTSDVDPSAGSGDLSPDPNQITKPAEATPPGKEA